MLSWLARKMIARNRAQSSAGNIEDTQQSKALDEYLASVGKA